jgi:hypothetical protein
MQNAKSETIPLELIAQMVAFRVAENQEEG